MADRSVEAAELTAAVAVLDYFASLHRMVLRLFSCASPVRRCLQRSLLGRMIRRRLGACGGRPLGTSLLSALAVAL